MSERFAQCDESCTVDCGHCKGQPVQALRAEVEALKRDRQWEMDRANEAARLSAEARDQAEELRREVERLGEHISAVEEDRAAAQRDAHHWKSARDATLVEFEIVVGQKERLRADLEQARAELAELRKEREVAA